MKRRIIIFEAEGLRKLVPESDCIRIIAAKVTIPDGRLKILIETSGQPSHKLSEEIEIKGGIE